MTTTGTLDSINKEYNDVLKPNRQSGRRIILTRSKQYTYIDTIPIITVCKMVANTSWAIWDFSDQSKHDINFAPWHNDILCVSLFCLGSLWAIVTFRYLKGDYRNLYIVEFIKKKKYTVAHIFSISLYFHTFLFLINLKDREWSYFTVLTNQ